MLNTKETAKWFIERDNFLILTHRSPDGDTIGCGAGLCRALREQGKTAYLLKNEEIINDFATYVEGLQIEAFDADYVVSVDIATEGLFPENAKQFCGKVDFAIDHHSSREDYSKESCIDTDKAAAGEIIYEIVSQWGPVSQEVAIPLYVAISTDTGCFVYGNTTENSHRVAAALMETGLDVRGINKIHFQTVTLGRLKLESVLVNSMLLYDEGSCGIVCVRQSILEELKSTERDTENISAFIGKVDGISLGITIREGTDGKCRISMRSNPAKIKANAVCGLLGGGGHDAASGASHHGTVEETIAAVVAAIEQVQGKKLIPVS